MLSSNKIKPIALWIEPSGILYQNERLLRLEVLRRPLGMKTLEFRPDEANSWHLVLVLPFQPLPQVIGCCILYPNPHLPTKNSHFLDSSLTYSNKDTEIKIDNDINEMNMQCKLTQMALSPLFQLQGYGSYLVELVENRAKEAGIFYIYVHARYYAIGFYSKLGYIIERGPFYEVGIEHYRMSKRLK